MAGPGWSERPTTVTLARSRAVNASPDAVWAVVSRPDAALLFDTAAMVTVVPYSALSCVLEQYGDRTLVRVQERLPTDGSMSLRTVDRSVGSRMTVLLEPRRSGARVHLEQAVDAPRSAAREVMAGFELLATPWLDAVATIATGFREFPQPRPEMVLAAAGRLGPETASLRGSRTVPASPLETWEQLVRPTVGRRFWTPYGEPAVGQWQYTITGTEQMYATVAEITAFAVGERLTTRPIAGGHHLAVIDWTLAGVAGGTQVTLSHECATSHVGLPPMVDQALDLLQERLAER